jgi:hypothetical protein
MFEAAYMDFCFSLIPLGIPFPFPRGSPIYILTLRMKAAQECCGSLIVKHILFS